MKIYIAATGLQEALLIEIADTATVYDLKKIISMIRPTVKITDQILSFRSKVLFDSDTMKISEITENSVIELLILKQKNVVFIKLPDNKIHELEVKDFAVTIDVFKKQIDKELKIPSKYQELFLNTIKLQDSDMLNEKIIGPGTILNLFLTDLNICVLLDGKHKKHSKQLLLPSNSKISQLKEKFATLYEIPVDCQYLKVDGQILDSDAKSLSKYNILNGATIVIGETERIIIYIKTTFFVPNEIPLKVFPGEKVEWIKNKIERVCKCNVCYQVLFWGSSLLADSDILREKGIFSGTLLDLVISPSILNLDIYLDQERPENFRVVCQTTESIRQLKEKLERLTKIPVGGQILYLNGKEISNDQIKLMEIRIDETSYIKLTRVGSLKVFIKTSTDKFFEMFLQKSDTIGYMKQKVEDREDIPTDLQTVIFDQKVLNDSKSINDYGISAESTIHLKVDEAWMFGMDY